MCVCVCVCVYVCVLRHASPWAREVAGYQPLEDFACADVLAQLQGLAFSLAKSWILSTLGLDPKPRLTEIYEPKRPCIHAQGQSSPQTVSRGKQTTGVSPGVDGVMPRIRDPRRPLGSRVRCKSERAFIRASMSSIPYLQRRPLFELARAQSPTCNDEVVRYQGERASFKRTKVLLGPRGSW